MWIEERERFSIHISLFYPHGMRREEPRVLSIDDLLEKARAFHESQPPITLDLVMGQSDVTVTFPYLMPNEFGALSERFPPRPDVPAERGLHFSLDAVARHYPGVEISDPDGAVKLRDGTELAAKYRAMLELQRAAFVGAAIADGLDAGKANDLATRIYVAPSDESLTALLDTGTGPWGQLYQLLSEEDRANVRLVIWGRYIHEPAKAWKKDEEGASDV